MVLNCTELFLKLARGLYRGIDFLKIAGFKMGVDLSLEDMRGRAM